MRDPARIQLVLSAIEALWRTCPDQRFGQLVANIMAGVESDPFHVEDEALYDHIQDLDFSPDAQAGKYRGEV